VDDLCRSLDRNELVLEEHTKQGNLRFDREALAGLHLSKKHRHCHALRRCDTSAAADAKRAFKKGLLCVRIPRVPVLNIFIYPEDRFGWRGDCDSVFNVHSGLSERRYAT